MMTVACIAIPQGCIKRMRIGGFAIMLDAPVIDLPTFLMVWNVLELLSERNSIFKSNSIVMIVPFGIHRTHILPMKRHKFQ